MPRGYNTLNNNSQENQSGTTTSRMQTQTGAQTLMILIFQTVRKHKLALLTLMISNLEEYINN